jgi:hypothetical protein
LIIFAAVLRDQVIKLQILPQRAIRHIIIFIETFYS